MATISRTRTVSVYEPTVTGLPLLRPYAANLWDRRYFIWHMARTRMKAQHYDTVMGVVWIVVDPLLMAATLYLIRVLLRPGPGGARLAANIIMGVTFFFLVSETFRGVAMSIVANRQMVLNSAAPRASYPAVVVMKAMIDLVPALAVYLCVHQLLGQPWGLPILVCIPIVSVMMALFGLGLGLAFAPLVVFFRDTGTLIPYITRVWLYVTPVMLTIPEIPKKYLWLFKLNPLFPFFGILEQVWTAHWPSLGYIVWASAITVVAMVVGVIAFLLRERDYGIRL
jgi:ABC-type polysaccharide/polyol phosphate export permease